MRRIFKVAGVFLVASLMAAAPTRAGTLDFDNIVDGGTLSYAGGAAPLVGTGILFDTLIAIGTGADGNYVCSGCILNFTTGPHFLSIGPIEAWSGGGSFTLTGAVTGVVGPTTLLTGSFGAGGFVGSFGVGGFQGGGSGTDLKDPTLLAFFDLNNPFIYTNTEFNSLNCFGGASAAFSCVVTESDLINTDRDSTLGGAPEPASLLLLGTGLLGIGYKVRRKMKKVAR